MGEHYCSFKVCQLAVKSRRVRDRENDCVCVCVCVYVLEDGSKL